jgi:hypothetical protein
MFANNSQRRWPTLFLAAACTIVWGSSTLYAPPAAGEGKPKDTPPAGKERSADAGNKPERDPRLPPGVPAPVDRSASINARRELEAARIALLRAEASADAISAVVDQELRDSPAYVEALLNLRRAQADYDRARFPVRETIRNDESYRADQRRKAEAQAELEKLLEQGTPSFSTVSELAFAAMRAGMRMTNAETIAMASEPTVEEARQRMLRAAMVVRQFHDSFREAGPNDPRIRAAKEDIEAAKARVKRANEMVADALKREAYLERLRQEQIERLKREGKIPAGYRD